jgi:hypothetical protein
MKPRKTLRNVLKVLRLVQRKAIAPARLKLIETALGAPARPWL